MKWSKVGNWLKENAGVGTALVGSLLTGNVPGAIAAGASLVAGATGTDDPDQVLAQLQSNPETMLRLRELYYQNEESVRRHLEQVSRLEMEDDQIKHRETQETIRAGDKVEDKFVRRTRPAQSWVSLLAALFYALYNESPDVMILGALLTLPWAYAGLRQVGKGIDAFTSKPMKK
jgi:hypothetical protein